MITTQERRIPINKKKIIDGLGVIVILGFMGFFAGHVFHDSRGWFVVAVFLPLAAIVSVQLLPGSAYLMLSPEGVTLCNFFRSRLCRWRDIQGFTFTERFVGLKKMEFLAFNYTEDFKRTNSPADTFLNNKGFEFDVVFPNSFKISNEELLSALREWHRMYAPEVQSVEFPPDKLEPLPPKALLMIIILIVLLISFFAVAIKYKMDWVNSKTSPDDTFLHHAESISQAIITDWSPPAVQGDRVLIIRFTVRRDGLVTNVRIKQSSGNPALDESGVKAIYQSQPLPPFPENLEYKKDRFDIELQFDTLKARKATAHS